MKPSDSCSISATVRPHRIIAGDFVRPRVIGRRPVPYPNTDRVDYSVEGSGTSDDVFASIE